MARTLNTDGKKYTRTDMWQVDPTSVVVDADANGRFEPIDYQHAVSLARQFINGEIGQIQACPVREGENKRLHLSAGFHRHAAALIVKKGDKAEGIPPHPDFKLKVTLKTESEDEAYVSNVAENEQRKNTTHMDRAVNMRRLRTIGKSDEDICLLFRRQRVDPKTKKALPDTVYLRKLERVLTLPREYQTMLHHGEINLEQAVQFADLSEDDRKQTLAEARQVAAAHEGNGTPQLELAEARGFADPSVVATVNRGTLTSAEAARRDAAEVNGNGAATATATATDGKVNSKAVRQALRKRNEDKGGEKRIGLTYSEFKQYLEARTDADKVGDNVAALCAALLGLAQGKHGERKADTVIGEVVKKR
jgi:ParB-like chromosome segregation protein Spo0J